MSKLFRRFDLSGLVLRNLVVMAAFDPFAGSRCCCDRNGRAILRSARNRSLIVSEGTPISTEIQGNLFNPGVFTPEQIVGWKLTTQSSPRRAVGAMAYGYDEKGKPVFVEVSRPRALGTDEIARFVSDYAQSAANAMEAGFDGVEIHGADGYLVDQFINPVINDRTDQYGASTMENRLRFALDVVDSVGGRIPNQTKVNSIR